MGMGSVRHGENDAKYGKSVLNIDPDTQPFNPDSQSSGEDTRDMDADDLFGFQNTVEYDETLPLEEDFTLELETNLVGGASNLAGETQVLEDHDYKRDSRDKEVVVDSYTEESNKTEVLSDSEGAADEMATSINRNFTWEGENTYAKMIAEKTDSFSSPCLDQQGRMNFLVGSDASTDEECGSGSAQKSFISIRSASVRSSGLAAARSMTPKSAYTDLNDNTQPLESQDNIKTPPCGSSHIRMDNIVVSLRGPPSSIPTEVTDASQDHKGIVREVSKSKIKNLKARKLFVEDQPAEKEMRCEIGHIFAGLSYVESQEPGELSQANALNTVDKFLHNIDIHSSEEEEPGQIKSIDGKSPPTSMLKGRLSLAQRTNLKSPSMKAGTFDWIDSLEDEGGGEFFNKRRDVLLGSRDYSQKSQTKSRKPNRLNSRRTHSSHKSREREKGNLQIHQKMMGIISSGSNFMLDRSREQDALDSKTNQSISKQQDEHLVEEPLDDVNGSQGMQDVGFDTQLAAEAMEALACGSTANHKSGDSCPVTRKKSDVSVEGTGNKKTRSRQVVRKRPSSTSGLDVTMRPSKQRKTQGNKLCKTNLKGLCEEQATKANANGNHTVQLNRSGRKSAKVIKEWKTNEAVDGTHNKNKNKYLSSMALDGTTTPVAHRTRQSITSISAKRAKISSKGSGLGTNCLMEVSISKKQRTNISDDAPEARKSQGNIYKSDANQNEMLRMMEGTQKKNNQTCYPTEDALSYPRRRRSRRNMIEKDDKKEDASLEASPKERIQHSNWLNASSPVCKGDNPPKQLGNRGSSKSTLMRELIGLEASEVRPVAALKYVRKRREMCGVCVLLSNHLRGDVIKQQQKILARLGASVASSMSDATHFIADEFARTRNMLEAIGLGKPVVNHLWLECCGQANSFIDEKNYILRDHKKEKEIGFDMTVSLALACHSPLLQGKRVFVTPNVKPSTGVIVALVKAVQGQAVERIGRSVVKDDHFPGDLLIISCEEDYEICASLLEKGAEVYNSELLLNGIVIQKLEYQRHRLFVDKVKRTRSTVWLKDGKDQRFHPVAKRT